MASSGAGNVCVVMMVVLSLAASSTATVYTVGDSSEVIFFEISPLMEEAEAASITVTYDGRRRRCCKKAAKSAADDIISRLPDEILCCKILSSISTKESVRTSILSKRWRYVWASVPNLVLDDSEFLQYYKQQHLSYTSRMDLFEQFMNSVLCRHKNVSRVHKFHLFCCLRYGLSTVNEWINTAIRRGILQNVEEIVVNVFLRMDVELSPSFFTSCSKKLVVLKLCPDLFLNVPPTSSGIYFPNLKIVHLDHVKFPDDDSVNNFVSGCPVLEEFDITISAALGNLRNLLIQSSTLKKLTVSLCDNYSDEKRDFEYILVIDSPNLQYLDLTDIVNEDCSVVNFLSSLVQVRLSVWQPPLVNDDVFNNRFIKLLTNISNAKHLELHWPEMYFFSAFHLPVSLNLTRLKVEISDGSWVVLPFLLQLSPNLRACYIGKLIPSECKWESPNCIPKCLLFCLEEIVITGFEACDNEIEMVHYFLKNGRVLKKMSIEFVEFNSKGNSCVREKLLAFPKASGTCKISF